MNISELNKLKRFNDNGTAYWPARALSKALGYSEYRHFIPTINRAKEECSGWSGT